jgi:asparagine synthase (glutamine-hydrolysing)
MAVDRFAVCSLCYRSDGDTLQVAERADALAGGGSTELSPQALFDYLYFHAIPSPRTIFAGVSRVPPAHCVLWQNGQLTVQRYWNPDFDAPVQQTSFGALRGEFRDLLKAGVSDQMDPQRPACFLSGGTDSSTVAGMLRQVSAGPVSSYSIGFDAEGYDEMAYARLASKHFDTEHHEYYVTPQDLVASIPSVAASYDQPFGNSSAVPAFYCARMAKLDGVQRILAGDGGDELFAGNVRYAKQRVFDLYGHVPAALRSALIEPLAAWPAGQGFPPLRKLASYVQQARQPMPGRMEGYNLLLRLGMSNVLAPEFLARVDAADPVHQQTGVWAQTQSSSSLNRQLAFDWRYTLAENDLPKVCGTAQLAGLTVGFPMLDARLVDFSLRLPTSYKLRVLRLRWFFKEALRGFLPDDIISKKKHGFGLPFGVWMTRNPALNTLAVDSLRSLGSRNIVRPAFIQDLLDNKLGSHPGYYGEMVWILMMLEQWLRVHSPDYRVA